MQPQVPQVPQQGPAPRLFKGPLNLQCMTTRYSLGELASKITKAIQNFDEQEPQDSCSGRRADDGRWYWHCLCTPTGHASSAATTSHTTDGGNLAAGMMQ